MQNPWEAVTEFERRVAEFAGAPHAVAVDTCSAAIFLCLLYRKPRRVSIPRRTFPGVAGMVVNAGVELRFNDELWTGEYLLRGSCIIDSACRFRRGMYDSHTDRCLSFQYRKHVAIGRGGMILTDDQDLANWAKLARFHGKLPVPLPEGGVLFAGWPFHFEPERAARGLMLLDAMQDDQPPDLSFDYPDVSEQPAYRQPHVIERAA